MCLKFYPFVIVWGRLRLIWTEDCEGWMWMHVALVLSLKLTIPQKGSLMKTQLINGNWVRCLSESFSFKSNFFENYVMLTLTDEIHKILSTSIRFLGLQTLWSLPYYWRYLGILNEVRKILLHLFISYFLLYISDNLTVSACKNKIVSLEWLS